MASALLIILSSNGDPDEITNAMSLSPYQSWRRGEPKVFVKRDGSKIQFDTLHERSGWKALVPAAFSGMPLQEQIRYWLDFFRTKKSVFLRIAELGWRPELNCFSAASDGFDLEPEELAELGDLGIRMSLYFSSCSD